MQWFFQELRVPEVRGISRERHRPQPLAVLIDEKTRRSIIDCFQPWDPSSLVGQLLQLARAGEDATMKLLLGETKLSEPQPRKIKITDHPVPLVTRMRDLFRQVDPPKLGKAPGMVTAFTGQEDKLYAIIAENYGVEAAELVFNTLPQGVRMPPPRTTEYELRYSISQAFAEQRRELLVNSPRCLNRLAHACPCACVRACVRAHSRWCCSHRARQKNSPAGPGGWRRDRRRRSCEARSAARRL